MTAQWRAYAESTFVRIAIASSGSRRSQAGGVGESGIASSNSRLETKRAATQTAPAGSTFLDYLDSDVGGLEVRRGNRATRDRDRLAAEAFQAILVEIVPEQRAGTTTSACGGPNAGGKDGRGQSALGCA